MKLPEIFKNQLNDNISNNKEIVLSKEERNNDILDNLPVRVYIKTIKGDAFNTTIINKTKNYLITKTNNVIYVKDIKEIKII